MFWKKKRVGRPVAGPRPDLALPDGDWSPFTLAFHQRANQVVSVIMADDEAVFEPLPRVEHGNVKQREGRIYREDRAYGCRFYTDMEGERGYNLRFSRVLMPVSDEERESYASLFQAWGERHAKAGAMLRFEDEDGVQYCWEVGDDDVIGVRLENLGPDISFSATRAWVLRAFREKFRTLSGKQTDSVDANPLEAKDEGPALVGADGVFISLVAVRSGARDHPYRTRATDGDDTKELAALIRKMKFCEPFDRNDLPRRLIKLRQMRVAQSALSDGFLFLNSRAADVFRKHDLGDGFLWEMPVVQPDGTPIPDEKPWFGLHIGTVKDTIDLMASTALRMAHGRRTLDAFRLENGEKQVALSTEAKSGPDVWREKHLLGSPHFFLSSELRNALHAAGLATDFDLNGCAITR